MQRYEIAIDEYTIHFYVEKAEGGQFLLEAKHKGIPLKGPYSAQPHPAHSPAGQKHIHVFKKNNELFALNVDGTAHDQSHGIRIPNKVADRIAKDFPDFKLPPGNIIEFLTFPKAIKLITEGADINTIITFLVGI